MAFKYLLLDNSLNRCDCNYCTHDARPQYCRYDQSMSSSSFEVSLFGSSGSGFKSIIPRSCDNRDHNVHVLETAQ